MFPLPNENEILQVIDSLMRDSVLDFDCKSRVSFARSVCVLRTTFTVFAIVCGIIAILSIPFYFYFGKYVDFSKILQNEEECQNQFMFAEDFERQHIMDGAGDNSVFTNQFNKIRRRTVGD